MFLPAHPFDSSPDAGERQVEWWRAMTIAEKVELIEQLNADVERLALTGIAMDHPGRPGVPAPAFLMA